MLLAGCMSQGWFKIFDMDGTTHPHIHIHLKSVLKWV